MNKSKSAFLKLMITLFSFATLLSASAFAATAESALPDLTEINKVRRMNDDIRMIRNVPRAFERIQPPVALAAFSAPPKIQTVMQVSNVTKLTVLPKTFVNMPAVSGSTVANQTGKKIGSNLESPAKAAVLSVVPKEKPDTKDWFGLVFKPRETKKR